MKKVITHPGKFHADEIFACAVMRIIFPGIKLIRCVKAANEQKECNDENTIVIDIGGKYDGKRWFDHHQKEFVDSHEDGIPMASFGLIWKHFGRKAIRKIYPDIKKEQVEKIWIKIQRFWVLPIDAADNGLFPSLLNTEGKKVDNSSLVTISQIINLFNPHPLENQRGNFEMVLDSISSFLCRAIQKKKLDTECESIVEKAIQERHKSIVILEKFLPWQDAVYGHNEKTAPRWEKVGFVISPSLRGGFQIQNVGIDKDIKSQKLWDFPESWLGLREELAKVTGIKTASFCHKGNFIASCGTREDAVKLAILCQDLACGVCGSQEEYGINGECPQCGTV